MTTATSKNPADYHPGEVSAQTKAGTLGVASELAVAKKSKLNFSSNHDAFLAAETFGVIASVHPTKNGGQIWVSPIFAKLGDIDASSEDHIVVSPSSIPKYDILHNVLSKPGTPLSMLGIDLMKRIRHRINGYSKQGGEDGLLHFHVNEYSPNCPKYINRRRLIPAEDTPINPAAVPQRRTKLSQSDQELIQSMDTLWLGTYAPGVGADSNHRGGRPGFIRVVSETAIEWPEYRGNGMFFSSGNLEVNDRAGVTMVDFETGTVLQLTGRARVDWNYNGAYEGATRLIRFEIDELVRTDEATNHRWKLMDYSPYNPSIAGKKDSSSNEEELFPTTVTLAKIVTESPNVKTFRWVAPKSIPFLPGQYATFEFHNVPGSTVPSEIRTWTLSETPNSVVRGDNTLDITVKRVGLVTNWLHDHASVGTLQATLKGIQGDMTAVTVNPQTKKPTAPQHLLLLSAGIGITPNVAMVRGVGAFQLAGHTKIRMIHVDRTEESLIFQSELHRRARTYPNFDYTNVLTSQEGRLTRERLQALLVGPIQDSIAEQQTYICGPGKFMTDMTDLLVSLGVPAANIHTESFHF